MTFGNSPSTWCRKGGNVNSPKSYYSELHRNLLIYGERYRPKKSSIAIVPG
jgi:hypothetical protein